MMSHARERGAVNLMMLFIITLVIAIGGWALWFGQFKDNEALKKKAKSTSAERDIAFDKVTALREAMNSFAKEVGEVPVPVPEPADGEPPQVYLERFNNDYIRPVRQRITESRNSLEADATLNTLMGVLGPAEAAINKRDTEIASLKNDLTQAKADKASAEQANDQLLEEQRTELARRSQELEDEKQRNATKEQQLESQKDDLSTQLARITDTYEKAVSTHRSELIRVSDTMSELDREVRDIKRGLRIKKEKDLPDGKILDVDYRTGLCWIDIGTKHVLRRGTRFRTYGFLKGKVKDYHGYIVVRDVEKDRALCALEGDARPERGDFVTNPYFDRDEQKIFYFLGNLPGRFNNQQAKAILEDNRAKVVMKFDPHVDFLVIGDNPDPDAVGEDANPNWFKETKEYTDALRWNIEMIRAKDLETFLDY